VFLSDLQPARTIPELVLSNAELVQHGQKQIRHRSVRRKLEVAASLQLTGGASNQQDRERIVIVLVTVAQGAAVEDE